MNNPIPQAPQHPTGKPLFPGRTVFYVEHEGLLLVATVVLVWNSAGTVNLYVLPNGVDVVGHPRLITSVNHSVNGESGTWHHLPQF